MASPKKQYRNKEQEIFNKSFEAVDNIVKSKNVPISVNKNEDVLDVPKNVEHQIEQTGKKYKHDIVMYNIPYMVIVRTYEELQTRGDALAVVDGQEPFRFKTLELPWLSNKRKISCIPIGEYNVVRHQSPRFGECFLVTEVVNRSHILIHSGSFAASKNPKTGRPDTLGCILPGLRFTNIDADGYADITGSRTAMNRLLDMFGDKFKLVIKL